MNENKAAITGKIIAAPEHVAIYGRNDLFKAVVQTCRNSGAVDDVIIIFPAKAVDLAGHKEADFLEPQDVLTIGKDVEIWGKVQTARNEKEAIIETLVFCEYIGIGYAEPQNDVILTGIVGREPNSRTTPKGRKLTDLIIKVPSIFANSFCCKVPVIAWEKCADMAAKLEEGDSVLLYGRLQSRKYIKHYEDGQAEEKTATEISTSSIVINIPAAAKV